MFVGAVDEEAGGASTGLDKVDGERVEVVVVVDEADGGVTGNVDGERVVVVVVVVNLCLEFTNCAVTALTAVKVGEYFLLRTGFFGTGLGSLRQVMWALNMSYMEMML